MNGDGGPSPSNAAAAALGDRPHPVPPLAYLRYKENWFFLILDPEHQVFGAIHVNSEPGFDRLRFACHLRVQGELIAYGSQVSFPKNFAHAAQLGDGCFEVRFVEAREQIEISLHNDTVDLEATFRARAPQFDFRDYDDLNPDKATVAEVMTLGTGQQHVHQQQAMTSRGHLTVKSGPLAGHSTEIAGQGYRDHSRAVRCDTMVARHTWTGLLFPRHVLGAVTVTGLMRPETPGSGGYVYDEQGGLRPLREIDIAGQGEGPEGLPAQVELRLTDIHDVPFTIIADLTQRHAHVPLHSETPGASPFIYDIVESFVPVTLKETGETGIGLVEIGASTPVTE